MLKIVVGKHGMVIRPRMISAFESILCESILGKMLLRIGLDKKKGHALGGAPGG